MDEKGEDKSALSGECDLMGHRRRSHDADVKQFRREEKKNGLCELFWVGEKGERKKNLQSSFRCSTMEIIYIPWLQGYLMRIVGRNKSGLASPWPVARLTKDEMLLIARCDCCTTIKNNQ